MSKLRVIHKGNFYKEFGIDVDCYVLDDENKTAVISQRGMGQALGMSEGGSKLTRFVSGKSISDSIGPELREKLDNPIIFQSFGVGLNKEKDSVTHGYDVTVLYDLCKAISDMESKGRLLKSQHAIYKQARIIMDASGKLGIQQLVYALSGYQADRQEIIDSFRMFVANEAREYEKEFPEQLYSEWYRIYDLPKPERNKPWKFMHLTMDHVYFPLAKSKGKLEELVVSQRAEAGSTGNKRLFQFLSEVGVKALRQHLGQLLGIAQLSANKAEYEKNVERVFGEIRSFRKKRDNMTIDMFAYGEAEAIPKYDLEKPTDEDIQMTLSFTDSK